MGTSHYMEHSTKRIGGRVIIFVLKPKEGIDPPAYKIKKLGELFLLDGVGCIKSFMSSYLLVSAGTMVHRLKIEALQRRLVISDTIEMRWNVTAMDTFPIPEGALVAIACQKESISLYKYVSHSKAFEFLGSDRISRLPTCVLFVNRNLILGADKFGNVFGLESNESIENGISIDQSLETSHFIHLGEPIIALLSGDIRNENTLFTKTDSTEYYKQLDNSVFKKAILFKKLWNDSEIKYNSLTIHAISITGSIYSIVHFPNETTEENDMCNELEKLQIALNQFSDTSSILGTLVTDYRKCKNIIDVDFLRTFLNLKGRQQESVLDVAETKIPLAQLVRLIECLID